MAIGSTLTGVTDGNVPDGNAVRASTDAAIPAIVLADGCFGAPAGKVAHGLVRSGDRFAVRAVVDPALAGRDAGDVLDGRPRGIPIVDDVAAALLAAPDAAAAIVGHAPHGGRLTDRLHAMLIECARAGLDLVSGLHDHLRDEPRLVDLASANGIRLIDVRYTPPPCALRSWDGSVHTVRADRIAVLGTDCIVGKRTTARALAAELNRRGVRTEMIYTGQTGWMQGARYGVIYDALVAGFTAGELEGAILACANDVDPDLMLIEGQGALRNPAGPCGSELILSTAARGVILQHNPHRSHYHGLEHLDRCRIPDLSSEIELIAEFGVPVLAVVLNLADVAPANAAKMLAENRSRCGDIPVFDVFAEGLGGLADVVVNNLRRT